LKIQLVFLVSTFMLASLAWGQRMPMQEGAQWETQRLVTSKAGRYEIVQTFRTGLGLEDDDDGRFTTWYGVRYDPSTDNYARVIEECRDFGNSILPDWENRRGIKCTTTYFCDYYGGGSGSDGIPTINEVSLFWQTGGGNSCPVSYTPKPGACTCVVAHGPYIDGARKDDILFYPINGLDWENANAHERKAFTVASAFFKKLWPQYGLNSPYHVAYCYDSLSFSEHNNPYLNGDICIEVFDNRAVLDLFSWDMGCVAKCTKFLGIPWFGEKDDCCCEANWIFQQDPTINIAHKMMNLGGVYTLSDNYRPVRLLHEMVVKDKSPVYDYLIDYPGLSQVTAGTGIRPEHNWSGVNGVWAYQTNHDVIDASQLQARRDHMAAIAGELDETHPDYDPDAPYNQLRLSGRLFPDDGGYFT
jgi:hypothetical protein